MGVSKEKKNVYVERVKRLFTDYPRLLVVAADNVGSKHFQHIRVMLRPESRVLMGKNTLIRRAVNQMIAAGRTDLKALLPYIKLNVGLVFTKGSLSAVKKKVDADIVPAAAKQGSIAPIDVTILAGPTGLEPTKTQFLQVLGIASKIAKSQIEILNDTPLITKGRRVTASQAALLDLLKIKPFNYGLKPIIAFENGALFDPSVLNLSDEDLLSKFRSGLAQVAAVSLAIGYPTVASVPHSFINAFKNVLAVSLATSYTIDQSKSLKELLADPTKLAALAAAAAAPKAGAAVAAAPAAAKKEEAPVEQEEVKIDGGLFGGGDEEW